MLLVFNQMWSAS